MPAPQSINLAKLQKEAEGLGISLDRDDDGTFWGKAPSGMELGGYDTATAALEDLKAVVTLDGATDLFDYDNDPDDDTLYRVTYKNDGMVFTDQALAVALSDALQHHTDQSRPAQPPKRRMRKPSGNGPQTIEHEPTVQETLPDPKQGPAELTNPEAKFHEPKPKKEDVTKNLIRSEDPNIRTPEMLTTQQQFAALLLQLADVIRDAAKEMGNEPLIPYGSAFEEPEDVKPKSARNRKGAN